jgi:outer membrane lipoprotein-sorting protein
VAAGLLAFVCALVGLPGSGTGEDTAALVEQVIAAHGGSAAWVALRDVSFTLTAISLTPQGEVASGRVSLYRLKRQDKARVETVTGSGVLIEGFDGQRPWAVRDGTRLTTPEALTRAHFQAVNWWYWVGIPFKWRDPGVILREREPTTFQGKPVAVLEVSYAAEGPTDRFTYYIDRATHYIVFVQTELRPGVWPGVGGTGWSTWHDYRTVSPFILHTRRVSYTSRDLTVKRSVLLFGDIQFNSGLPDRLFEAP